MSGDVQNVQLYGPVAVVIGGVDMGHTDEKGVNVAVKGNFVDARAGKYGMVPVQKWLNGQTVEVTFTLIETVMSKLIGAIPGAAYVTDGTNEKLTFGFAAGKKLLATTLKLTPYPAGNSPMFDFTLSRAVPVGDFTIKYSGDGYNSFTCTFHALVDEAGSVDGSFVARFGNDAASADLVAPTFTVVPANAATGVSVGAVITWTASKNLNSDTVNGNSVHLVKDPSGTPVDVGGTVHLTNAGAATTIVFTPSAPLSASTIHLAILETSIEDTSGNNLAAMKATRFTTA